MFNQLFAGPSNLCAWSTRRKVIHLYDAAISNVFARLPRLRTFFNFGFCVPFDREICWISDQKSVERNSKKNISFTNAARKWTKHCDNLSILIDWSHLTIAWFPLFNGLFQRTKMHFRSPNSPFYPPKCTTIRDKEIIVTCFSRISFHSG